MSRFARVIYVFALLFLGARPVVGQSALDQWFPREGAAIPERSDSAPSTFRSRAYSNNPYLTRPQAPGAPPTAAYSAGPAVSAGAEWTLMIYMAADNNLDAAAVRDLEEMERIGSSEQIQIVVFVDRDRGWQTARQGLILPRPESGVQSLDPRLPTCEDLGEVDSGSAETFERFVQWAARAWPARRYGLIVWNHGGGWRSLDSAAADTRAICLDYDSNSRIYNADLRRALERSGQRFEIIAMDACLMGMVEVAYEMKDLTPVFVGSAQNIPTDGFEYTSLLTEIQRNPTMDGRAMGRAMVDTYGRYYRTHSKDLTLSAVDTSRLEPLAHALNDLIRQTGGQAVGVDDPARVQSVFSSAREKAGLIDGNRAHVDLGLFLEAATRQEELSPSARQAAGRALDAYRNTLIHSFANRSRAGTGLAVFLPEKTGTKYYSDYTAHHSRFAADTVWPQFIHAYAGNQAMDLPPDALMAPVEPTAPAVDEPAAPLNEAISYAPAPFDESMVPEVRIRGIAMVDDRQEQLVASIRPGRSYGMAVRSSTRNAAPGLDETVFVVVADRQGRLIEGTASHQTYRLENGDYIYRLPLRVPERLSSFIVVAVHVIHAPDKRVVQYDTALRAYRLGDSGMGRPVQGLNATLAQARAVTERSLGTKSLNGATGIKRVDSISTRPAPTLSRPTSASSPLDVWFEKSSGK